MKCVYCGLTNFDNLFGDIYRCSKCGLVKTKGEFDFGYSEYHRDAEYKQNEKLFRNIFEKRYKIISKYKNTGKVLEIGCSTGILLEVFNKYGWETWGVEPSGSSRAAVDKGIKLVRATIEKAKLPKNFFDVVILNHTLEHVEDPVAVLKIAYSLLKSGGIVYVDVPNFGSLQAKFWGKNWGYLMPSEHVHHFEPSNLSKVVKKAGFKVVWMKTWSGIFDVFDPLKHFLLRPRSIFKIPVDLLTTLFNRGTSLAIVGKKG